MLNHILRLLRRPARLGFLLLLSGGGLALQAALETPKLTTQIVGPGLAYIHEEVAEVPWSIHVVRISRSQTNLQFETTLGSGKYLGMALVSDQVKAMPSELGTPLAAVNGDFFKSDSKYPGDPEGLQILRGELISAPTVARSCFWIDGNNAPHMTNASSRFTVVLPNGRSLPFGLNENRGKDEAVLYTSANGASTRTSGGLELVLVSGTTNNHWLPLRAGEIYKARVRQMRTEGDSPLSRQSAVLSFGPKLAEELEGVHIGDVVTLSTATTPSMAGSKIGMGGGPALVHGRTAMSFGGLQPRHPRTAIGWNKDYYYLVEVDGRQRFSAGMTFAELANYMVKMGCDEALNLDGGGSATMWVDGKVVNSPSEGRERPAANALVVVRK